MDRTASRMIEQAFKDGYLTTSEVSAVMSKDAVQAIRAAWKEQRHALGLPYIELVKGQEGACIVSCGTHGLHPDVRDKARRAVKKAHREMIAIIEGHGGCTDACVFRQPDKDAHTVGYLTLEKGLELVGKLNEIRSPLAPVA